MAWVPSSEVGVSSSEVEVPSSQVEVSSSLLKNLTAIAIPILKHG
ncbi:hypothetical protein [Nostoc sp.]